MRGGLSILIASLPPSFSFNNISGGGSSPHLKLAISSWRVNLAKVESVEAGQLEGKGITTSTRSNIY